MNAVVADRPAFSAQEVEESLPERFERMVANAPGRPAVRGRGASLTYAELDASANRIAHAILARDAGSAGTVALLFDHGTEMIAALWGVLKALRIYVPLHPAHPDARLAALVSDCKAGVVLTHAPHAERAAQLAGPTTAVIEVDGLGGDTKSDSPGLKATPGALANICYTSGTTGEPKGVTQNHRNILADARRMTRDLSLTAADRLALLFPLAFSAATSPIFGALLNGFALHTYDVQNEGPAGLPHWLKAERVTVFHCTPQIFRHMVQALPQDAHFPHLRLIGLGGEPVKRSEVELFRQHFPAPCRLQIAYATTETRVAAQIQLDGVEEWPDDAVPVGPPVEGKEVLLLTADGNAAEVGEAGEIVVRSRFLSPGYWQRPELTARTFPPCDRVPGCRLFYTGDLGRMDSQGRLYHLGRKDSQVKIRGVCVEPGEVEHALCQHPAIKEAVVASLADGPATVLAAWYTTDSDAPPDEAELRALLQRSLPEAMIPAHFVPMPCLPLTTNGKVDRSALPTPGRPRTEAGANDADTTDIIAIWEDLLRQTGIGASDNFFALGGDSLLALSLCARIERQFGTPLQVADLLQAPTPAGLASALSRAATDGSTTLVPLQTAGRRPPLFLMPTLSGHLFRYGHLVRHLGDSHAIYGIQDLGSPEATDREESLEQLAARILETLRREQPQGPYRLGGFSFGGMLAYEAARQLRADGQDVALVALFDTLVRPSAPHVDGLWLHGLLNVLLRIRFHLEALRLSSGEERWRRLTGLVRRPPTPDVRAMAPDAVANAELAREREARNTQALRAYTPQPYAGRVAVFQTRRHVWESRELGDWRALTSHLEIYKMPSGHTFLMEEPRVRALAKALRRCLDADGG